MRPASDLEIDDTGLAVFIAGLSNEQRDAVMEAYRRNPRSSPVCVRIRGDGRGPDRVVDYWLNPEVIR